MRVWTRLWVAVGIFSFQVLGSQTSFCKKLLTVGTPGDPITILTTTDGTLQLWTDKINGIEPLALKQYTRVIPSFRPGMVVDFGVEQGPDPSKNSPGYPLMVALDGKGNVRLSISPERSHPFIFKNIDRHASAVALYRTPIRDLEVDIMSVGLDGLHAVEEQQNPKKNRANFLKIAALRPIEIYVAFGQDVYRGYLRPVPIPEHEAFLSHEPIFEIRNQVRVEGTAPSLTPFPVKEGILDLNRIAENRALWIKTLDPKLALNLSPFKKVYSLENSASVDSINHLVVLDRSHLMIANESGAVSIIDIKENKVVATPQFPGLAWLSSITAHKIGDEIQVWAINAVDKNIYRWTSQSKEPNFKVLDSQLPEKVSPVSIASTGYPRPVLGEVAEKDSGFNYFTHYHLTPKGVYAQRVLVMGSDGQLYGWRQAESANSLLTGNEEWRWVTRPHEQMREAF